MGDIGRPVKTTEASLSILETIHRLGGATLNDLHEHLEMAKSTILNHLTTLEDRGYLVQEGQIYFVGLKFLYFGEHAKRQHPAFRTGQDLTHWLAHTTNEEVDFSVHEHGRIITLHHEIGHNNEPGRQIGQYFYMHNTAAGKAIFAELPRERVQTILNDWGMPSITEHTITDQNELYDELEEIQRRGFATNEEEHIEGYHSLSKAAVDPDGNIIGTFSVGAPTYRIALENLIKENVVLLEQAVTQLEDQFS